MNELKLSNDLNQIEFEINQYKNSIGQSVFEIGRRLNHVKENDLVHGEFNKWLDSIGIEYRTANRFMKVAKELPNVSSMSDLGYSVLYLIATLPDDEKQEQIERIEQGETPTQSEIKQLKKQLKEKDEQVKHLETENSDLKNKSPEVVEKIVEKEVAPIDYNDTKEENKQFQEQLTVTQLENEQIKKRLETKETQLKELEKEFEELKEKQSKINENSKKYEELNEKILEMNGQLNEGQKRLNAQKDIYKFTNKANETIDSLSTLIYLVDEKELAINDYAREPIETIVTNLEDITERLREKINQSEIIEGEFTHEKNIT